MVEHYRRKIFAKNSRFGPLHPYVAAFSDTLVDAGYARFTVNAQLRLVEHLGRWMQRTNRQVGDLGANAAAAFLRAYRRRLCLKASDRCALRHIIEHLQAIGITVIPDKGRCQHKQPFLPIEERYQGHLLKERGLTPGTVERYAWFVHRFLLSCHSQGLPTLKKLRFPHVWSFITEEARCTGPKRAQLMVSALRSFSRFLIQEGEIQTNLASSIPSVPCRALTSLPKYINETEVNELLASCDRETAVGRRDYAILLLLARLGLRAGEVSRLQLEDIKWRSGEIRVSGKGQVRDVLPLLPDVGEALSEYLQRDRPRSSSRNVFLRVIAPHAPFGSTNTSVVVMRAVSRAGLHPPHRGAHLLRHSLATTLLRRGASMAEIAEVLRHRSRSTTEIYAKVDNQSLRTLARPWPTMGGAR